jgi:hypothetical protein
MPLVGFEPTVEWPQMYAIDHMATGLGYDILRTIFIELLVENYVLTQCWPIRNAITGAKIRWYWHRKECI